MQSYSVICAVMLVLALQGCGGSSLSSTDELPDFTDVSLTEPADDGDGLFSDSDGVTTSLPVIVGELPLQGVNTGPEGGSSLVVNDRVYPLNSGLGDIWGVSDQHHNVNFTLSNGKFIVSPTVLDGREHNLLVPVESTAVFYAELYSPGDTFSFVTFSYAEVASDTPDSDALAGVAYFTNAFVGYDMDLSGEVEADEKLLIQDGTVEFAGSVPDIELNFSATLENGELVQGHYTGLFDFTDRN